MGYGLGYIWDIYGIYMGCTKGCILTEAVAGRKEVAGTVARAYRPTVIGAYSI